MKRRVRSAFLGMRASARFGRACKLRDAGKTEEALKMAREALAILGHPDVIRFNPAEGAVLLCATVLVEELAAELKVSGAGLRDIVDALRYIRAVGPEGQFASWMPYFEHKAAQGRRMLLTRGSTGGLPARNFFGRVRVAAGRSALTSDVIQRATLWTRRKYIAVD